MSENMFISAVSSLLREFGEAIVGFSDANGESCFKRVNSKGELKMILEDHTWEWFECHPHLGKNPGTFATHRTTYYR